MRILFLGGTSFVGRHTVEAALERGHEVAFLHRGHTGADLHPAAERIVADRKADLGALAGRTFDAVIDTSGYFPADVERSTAALRESAGRYLFVSTRSVYADTSTPGLTETAALAELPPAEPTDAITGENYGPLKALCEVVVRQAFGDRSIILRPGLIVGPYDPTGRFAYWPARVAEGGDVLCPAPAEQPVQVIDARDLAAFALDLVEGGGSDTFDVVCQGGTLTFEAVIEACIQAAGQRCFAGVGRRDLLAGSRRRTVERAPAVDSRRGDVRLSALRRLQSPGGRITCEADARDRPRHARVAGDGRSGRAVVR